MSLPNVLLRKHVTVRGSGFPKAIYVCNKIKTVSPIPGSSITGFSNVTSGCC